MLHDMKNGLQSTIAPYIGAIVDDVVTLIRQEMALLKSEVREEVAKAKKAAFFLSLAAGLAVIAAFLFSMALVTALAQYVPQVPAWGWYLIVGAVVALGAGILLKRAGAVAASVTIPVQTLETVKESLPWTQSDA